MRELTGHTSAATAYVVADYPYTKRQKTSIRFWVETKRQYGQRFVSQVWNPARGGRWRTAHASRYAAVTVLYLGASGHVEFDQLRMDARERELDAFQARYQASCATAHNAPWLRIVRAHARARRRLAWHRRYAETARELRVIYDRLVMQEWVVLDGD